MKLTIWDNPKKENDIRIYVNGLYPFQKGVYLPKFYLVKKDNTFILKSSKEFDLTDAEIKFKESLIKLDVISSLEDFVSWEDILKLESGFSEVKKDKKDKKETIIEQKDSSKEFQEKSNRIYDEYLNIRNTEFPQNIKLKLRHNLPATIKDFIIEHPQIESEVLNLPEGSILFEHENLSLIIEVVDCNALDSNGTPLFEKKLYESNSILNLTKMGLMENTIPVFIFEGELYNENSIKSPLEFDSFYSFLIGNKKINTFHSYNKRQTINFIFNLINSILNNKPNESLLNNSQEKKEETKRCLLSRIPTLNTNDVNELLNMNISIKDIALLSIEEIIEINGFDLKKAMTLKRILDS